MRRNPKHLLLTALWCLSVPLAAAPAVAPKQTVCTVTVNSADEKAAFRRYLPESKYRFVELVERGRPDWLASACRAQVACDVLIISGHYDGNSEFFSDQLDVREYLPVAELERVSCSDACPGLFARLKEVYLFGCNTLNPQLQSTASADIVKALVRDGHARPEAERRMRALHATHNDSSRDRMRMLFKDVPAIYGFSSTAPLGPYAASTLDRYFRAGGTGAVASGRHNDQLLSHFAAYGMSSARGMSQGDPQWPARQAMCRFADDRRSTADKLGFMHQLLQGNMAQTRLHLDRIQRLVTGLDASARQAPPVAQALDAIAGNGGARTRFLAAAREAEQPEVRVRMIELARHLGWLTPDDRRGELAQMFRELQARRTVGAAELNLACTLNQNRELDGAMAESVAATGSATEDIAQSALHACLGSPEGRAQTLAGLLSPNEAVVRTAQTYLRHRPITDDGELRRLAAGIVAMRASPAQEAALEALGRHYLSDGEVLGMLTRLFAETPSPSVQAAIAGILIRADAKALAASPQLLRTLTESRRPTPGGGGNMIDALIRRLHTS